MAESGDNAEFVCSVDANPIKADTIKWVRAGGDGNEAPAGLESRMITANVSNALYLTVRNVTAKDSGAFECVANNGVGKEVRNKTYLLVRGA